MSLRERALGGVAWSALERWGGQLMQLVVFVVLVRLVPPEAFGLVALATVFVAFADVFVDQGLASAIVQREELDDAHLDTAFWMTMGAALLMAGSTLVLADPVATLLGDARLAPVLRWLALLFPIGALNGVQQAVCERRLDFRTLSIRSLFAILAGGAAGIAAALLGYGVWALVVQELVRQGTAVVLLWATSAWRPGFRFSPARLRELLTFGLNGAGIRILNFANTRADDLLVGYFLGPVQLGYYSVGYRGTRMVTNVLTSMVSRVAFPVFSRLQGEPERMRRAFYMVTEHMSLVSFPVFIGIAVAAPDLVPALFGPTWAPSVPVMQVLAFIGILHSLFYFNSTVVMAMGKAGWRLAMNSLNAAANVLAFAIAVRWGIVAVAAAFVARGYLLSPIPLLAVRKLIAIDFGTYLRRFVPPLVGSAVMAGAIVAARALVADADLGPWPRVAMDVVVGLVAYLVVLSVVGPRLLRETLAMAGQLVAARRGGARRPAERAPAQPAAAPRA